MYPSMRLLLAVVVVGFGGGGLRADDFDVPINRERWKELQQQQDDWTRKNLGKLIDPKSAGSVEKDGFEFIQAHLSNNDWRPFHSEAKPGLLKLKQMVERYPAAGVENVYLRYCLLTQKYSTDYNRLALTGTANEDVDEWNALFEATKKSNLAPYIRGVIYLECVSVLGGKYFLNQRQSKLSDPAGRREKAEQVYTAFLGLVPEILKDKDIFTRYFLAGSWSGTFRHLKAMGIPLNEWWKKFDAVLKTLPEEEILRHYAAGTYYVDAGWMARGSDFASKVTEEKFDKFGEHLEAAQDRFTRCWKLADKQKLYIMSSGAALQMLTVGMGLGLSRDEEAEWFQRCIAARGSSYQACQRYFLYLEPKWKGSVKEMHQLAKRCYECGFYEDNIPHNYLRFVYFMKNNRMERELNQLEPNHWDRVQTYYDKMERTHGGTKFLTTEYLRAAISMGGKPKVEELLEKLDYQPHTNFTLGDEQAMLDRFNLQRKGASRIVAGESKPEPMRKRETGSGGNTGNAKSAIGSYVPFKKIKLTKEGEPTPEKYRPIMMLLSPEKELVILSSKHYSNTKEVRLQFLSPEGETLRTVPLPADTTCITYGSDQRLYAFTNGKLIQLDKEGKTVESIELNYIRSLQRDEETLQKLVDKDNLRRKNDLEENEKRTKEQIEALEKTPPEKLEKHHRDYLESLKKSLGALKLAPQLKPITVTEIRESLTWPLLQARSLLVEADAIYFSTTTPFGDLVFLWKLDRKGQNAKVLIEVRSQGAEVEWLYWENKFYAAVRGKLHRFSADGQMEAEWLTEKRPDFSKPRISYIQAILPAPDKHLYLQDYNGTVLRYTLTGEVVEYVMDKMGSGFRNLLMPAQSNYVYLLQPNEESLWIQRKADGK